MKDVVVTFSQILMIAWKETSYFRYKMSLLWRRTSMTGFKRELINIWPGHFPPLVLLLVILEFSFYPLVARVELLLPLFPWQKEKKTNNKIAVLHFLVATLVKYLFGNTLKVQAVAHSSRPRVCQNFLICYCLAHDLILSTPEYIIL